MLSLPFGRLPQELRDKIWLEAAAIQYQHIADEFPEPHATGNDALNDTNGEPLDEYDPNVLPKLCVTSFSERQRQAFVGYDNLPSSTELQLLRLYIYGSHHSDAIRLGANEFQTLVNRLPVSTVCADARAQAVKFCRAQIKTVNLFYYIEDPTAKYDEILEPVFTHIPEVMVTTGPYIEEFPREFSSADHLVDVISRIFGTRVERVVLSAWSNHSTSLDLMYWPHALPTRQSETANPIYIDEHNHSQSTIYMTPNRNFHVPRRLENKWRFRVRPFYWHLLKFFEIHDASTDKLPLLNGIELEQHLQVWGEIVLMRIKSHYDDGILWAEFGDYKKLMLDFYRNDI